MNFKTRSSFLALLFNGKIAHIINPWVLRLNFNDETITVEKRNWYFIGKDRNIISFRFIRNIKIDEHLFGADIYIKAIGGNVSAKYLPKRHLRRSQELMIQYNNSKGKRHVIFS
ncbi:hypothetical protein [Salinimicrobium gaetbulicola]|uniref:PH (Pleckstrin Homology) domain-containing protein n=1 Tax=Salinimicrobium gaetbulicola TaxID=999702 RepID=A0ABW3IEL9_9FLAO